MSAQFKRDSGVIILVMGQTGAGKGHFINIAAGKDIAPVNHSATCGDLTIRPFELEHPESGRSLVLVDTPGFDHFSAPDREVLHIIIDWMKHSCSADAHFGGIIYLQDITQRRTKLGPMDFLTRHGIAPRVVLTTSKWDAVDPDPIPSTAANDRENEFITSSWENIINRGARTHRFLNTHNSAREVVNTVLQRDPLEFGVIQNELRTQGTKKPDKSRQKRGFFSSLLRFFGARNT